MKGKMGRMEKRKREKERKEEKGRKSFSLLVRIRRSGSAPDGPGVGCTGLMDQIINYGTGMGVNEKCCRWIERERSS